MAYHRLHYPLIDHRLSPLDGPPGLAGAGFGRVLGTIFASLAAWRQQRRGGREMKRMNANLLADIGLQRAAGGLIRADIDGITGHRELGR
jgi:hypothetical protein